MKDHQLNEIEIINIEDYAKAGKPVPKEKKYRIRVDKEHYDLIDSVISGREILLLAGKQPVEQFRLDIKLKHGATRKVELEEKIDLTEPGIERFMTLPLDQTEG